MESSLKTCIPQNCKAIHQEDSTAGGGSDINKYEG